MCGEREKASVERKEGTFHRRRAGLRRGEEEEAGGLVRNFFLYWPHCKNGACLYKGAGWNHQVCGGEFEAGEPLSPPPQRFLEAARTETLSAPTQQHNAIFENDSQGPPGHRQHSRLAFTPLQTDPNPVQFFLKTDWEHTASPIQFFVIKTVQTWTLQSSL